MANNYLSGSYPLSEIQSAFVAGLIRKKVIDRPYVLYQLDLETGEICLEVCARYAGEDGLTVFESIDAMDFEDVFGIFDKATALFKCALLLEEGK